MAEPNSSPTLILGVADWGVQTLLKVVAQKFPWSGIVPVEKGKDAYEEARKAETPVLLLDAELPYLKGMYLCRMLKQHPKFSFIPIGLIVKDEEGRRKLESLGIFPDVIFVMPFTEKDAEENLATLFHLATEAGQRFSLPPLENFLDVTQESLSLFFHQVHSLMKFQEEITGLPGEKILQKYVEEVQRFASAEKAFLLQFDALGTSLIGSACAGYSSEAFRSFWVRPENGKFLGSILNSPKFELFTPQQYALEESMKWLVGEEVVGFPLNLEEEILCNHWWDCGTPACCIYQRKRKGLQVQSGAIQMKGESIALVTMKKTFGIVLIANAQSLVLFSPFAHRVLKGFTNTMLGFLDRTQATEELQNQVSFLNMLQEASTWMTRSLDLRETLHNIIQTITRTLDAGRGSVMLLESDGFLRIYVATGIEPEIARKVQIKPGESLAGWVFVNQKPLLITDIEETPFAQTMKEGYATRSALVVPLISDGEVMGVLNLADKKTGKPFTQQDLDLLNIIANYAVVALKNARLYWELKDSYFATIRALSEAIEAKDPYTKGHSDRVALYTEITAKEMGIPPQTLELLRMAGILHDVGKIGIPESVLLKPTQLTEEEFKIMRKHAEYGDAIIQPIKFLFSVRPAVRSHHEWYAGGGYPDGLKGEEIPLIARIMAVADAFDAMCSERKYRPAIPVEKTLAILEENAGVQFDPEVVDVFVNLVKSKKIPPPSELRT